MLTEAYNPSAAERNHYSHRGAAAIDSLMTQASTADRPAGDERAARARIDAAGKLLRGGKSDAPDGFAALLFGGVAPEDLVDG